MSVTISVSNTEEGVWIIRNEIYRWFVGLARDRFGDDDKLIDALQRGEYLGGVSLDLEHKDNPAFAIHLRNCIRELAAQIAVGRYELVNWPEMQDKCNAAFMDLVAMLDRHEFV